MDIFILVNPGLYPEYQDNCKLYEFARVYELFNLPQFSFSDLSQLQGALQWMDYSAAILYFGVIRDYADYTFNLPKWMNTFKQVWVFRNLYLFYFEMIGDYSSAYRLTRDPRKGGLQSKLPDYCVVIDFLFLGIFANKFAYSWK